MVELAAASGIWVRSILDAKAIDALTRLLRKLAEPGDTGAE